MYTKDEVMVFVEQEDVKFIRLAFCDIYGNQKNISIMPTELERAFKYGIPFDASAVKGFAEETESDLYLFPDPSTLAVLPWRPSHGRVVRMFCDIRHPDGQPFAGDTRQILKRAAAEADKAGINVDFGAEFEFYLFKTDENGEPTNVPFDNAGYLDIAPEDRGEDVRREICFTLTDMGIIPESSHHEVSPGQHEIDFCRSEALSAADNAVTFKSVVKTIAMRNGLFATFDPKPLPELSGNGMHVNMAVTDGSGRDVSSAFMAGILSHIRELTAYLNPTENSYKRFGEKKAPRYITWSPENRSQLIRFINDPGATERRRMELRSPDAMANPYLAYALLIFAGLEGIQGGMTPPEPLNLSLVSADKSVTNGLKSLPSSLAEAIRVAGDSHFIKRVLPGCVIQAYAAIAR